MTQVVFDAATSPPTFVNHVSLITWTHTPVGTPTAVAVIVSGGFYGETITSVTYGGAAMTLQDRADNAGGGGAGSYAAIYGLANPAAGAQTVNVQLAGVDYYAGASSLTVTGSDLTTCFSASNNTTYASSASPTISVTTGSEDLVIDGLCINAAMSPLNGYQTQRWDAGPGAIYAMGCSTANGTGGSVSMGWNCGAGVPSAYIVAAFKAGGSSSSVIKTFDGLANASTKTVLALANASVKTFNGVANT